MSSLDLMAATRAIEKSMPFVVYRLLISMGAALGFLFATLAGAGTLVGFGSLTKNALAMGPIGAIIGFALFGFLMYRLRPLWLEVVKAPQLALLADQAGGVSLPSGKALVEYAKRRQADCFPSRSALFELDETIRQTLRDMAASQPSSVNDPAKQSQIQPLVAKAEQGLSALNHQTVLAWHFRSGADDADRTAIEALTVAQTHHASLFRNRVYASAFAWLGSLASYPLLLGGIRELIEDIPVNMSFWPYVFAGVFAWAIKTAFFDAIVEAAMAQWFFPLAAQGAEPGAADQLAERSTAFVSLQTKVSQH